MSKPTDFQKRVIEAIKSELDYWASSNDINSPSHSTSTEHDMSNHMDEFWPDEESSDSQILAHQLGVIAERVQMVWDAVENLNNLKP